MKGSKFSTGDQVKWKWGSGYGRGTVQSIFPEKTTRVVDGEDVTRNGSHDDPAIYVDCDDSNNVLKLASELEESS